MEFPQHPAEPTLEALVTLGSDIARTAHRRIMATPDDQDITKDTSAFNKVATSIRRTILLLQSLRRPKPARPPNAKRRILRRVENAIHAAASDDPERAEALHQELVERLERGPAIPDLETTDIEATITSIIRDLGLDPAKPAPPIRRTPAQIDTLIRRANGETITTPFLTPVTTPDEDPRVKILSPGNLRAYIAEYRTIPRHFRPGAKPEDFPHLPRELFPDPPKPPPDG